MNSRTLEKLCYTNISSEFKYATQHPMKWHWTSPDLDCLEHACDPVLWSAERMEGQRSRRTGKYALRMRLPDSFGHYGQSRPRIQKCVREAIRSGSDRTKHSNSIPNN
ncbi:hypothetical protein AVEN_72798-1 [Araneus ventricosus]|uniref:Uncharacterized protein n=1 Tax=Araneus ventricosus TaxID=182803 RepID=A0A4Y2JGC2_ARAVE|nr:hypothetical protein AVEN_72798-1 [Araneus ventricosus]